MTTHPTPGSDPESLDVLGELLLQAYEDDCGLSVWSGREELLLALFEKHRAPPDDYWADVLRGNLARREERGEPVTPVAPRRGHFAPGA